MKSILNSTFSKTVIVVALGHILCDNAWWALGRAQIGEWWYMPLVVTAVSLVIALVIEKRIHNKKGTHGT